MSQFFLWEPYFEFWGIFSRIGCRIIWRICRLILNIVKELLLDQLNSLAFKIVCMLLSQLVCELLHGIFMIDISLIKLEIILVLHYLGLLSHGKICNLLAFIGDIIKSLLLLSSCIIH